MGAWIETHKNIFIPITVLSHPVWVRGLKRSSDIAELCEPMVAPCMGAWIETTVE